MRKTHLIPNPRYNRYESTHIRCSDGIYNIVFNWSPEHLAKFDNFLNKHAMYTSSEQVVYEVCTTTPYIVERYNELVDQVNAVRGDESKIVEYDELKKSRAKLVKTLLSTFPLLHLRTFTPLRIENTQSALSCAESSSLCNSVKTAIASLEGGVLNERRCKTPIIQPLV